MGIGMKKRFRATKNKLETRESPTREEAYCHGRNKLQVDEIHEKGSDSEQGA